ncbi:MAG TPA: FCD domain-containing protein [bacterium]|nr:FCD domain-containing protein [bacterium]
MTALTAQDAHEIYSLMVITERLAFRLVKRRMSESLLAELREALRAMRAAAGRGDILGVARADLQFTDTLFQHTAHRRLQRIWQGLKFQSYLLVRDYASRVYPSLPAVVEHHTKIVHLLENARWDQLLAYLEENGDRIEVRLLESPDVIHAPGGSPP